MFQFNPPGIEDADLLFNWRVDPRINDKMTSDLVCSREDVKSWIQNKIYDKTYFHWIIIYQKEKIGFLNINNVNIQEKTCDWGFYIGNKEYLGFGGIIPCYLFNYLFFDLCFKNIFAEIMEDNESAIKLNKFLGFKILKPNSITVEKKIGTKTFSSWKLSREDWIAKKSFRNYRAYFTIDILS